MQAHSDVNVMVGSSQAILGADQTSSRPSKVKLIGNGSLHARPFAGVNDRRVVRPLLHGLPETSARPRVDVGVARPANGRSAAHLASTRRSCTTRTATKDVLADVEGIYSDLG